MWYNSFLYYYKLSGTRVSKYILHSLLLRFRLGSLSWLRDKWFCHHRLTRETTLAALRLLLGRERLRTLHALLILVLIHRLVEWVIIILTELTHAHLRVWLALVWGVARHQLVGQGLELRIILAHWVLIAFLLKSVLVVVKDILWSGLCLCLFDFKEMVPIMRPLLFVSVEVRVLLIDTLQKVLHLLASVVILLFVFRWDTEV